MSNVSVFNRFGSDVSDVTDIDEVIAKADLNWDVIRDNVYARPMDPNGEAEVVPGMKLIRRSDTGRVFSVMSDKYRPVQMSEKAQIYKDLIGESKARFDRVLSIDGGRRMILTAKLPDSLKVGPDDIDKYFMLFDSFDGSLPFGVGITPVRVVCQNTLMAAIRAAKTMFKMRHSLNVTHRVAEARRALGLVDRSYGAFQHTANQLLATRVSDKSMVELATALFPQKGDDDSEVGGKLAQARNKVIELFTEGAGHGPVRGTAWAAYNAVVEYVDHHRGGRVSSGRSKAEANADSILFGAGAGLKAKALSLLAA